ncbi:MAG: copper chaperone PCu(A)C [Rhodospirillales bacterium]
MFPHIRTSLIILCLAAVLLGGAAVWSPAPAHEHMKIESAGITVTGAWARPTIAKMRISAAYFEATITSGEDKLLAAKTAKAEKAELHQHVMEGDIARMRPVDAVPLSPGHPAVFQPTGYHVMIMGLKGPLNEGDSFPLTLVFEKAGEVTIDVMVMKKAAQGHGNMDHGAHKH